MADKRLETILGHLKASAPSTASSSSSYSSSSRTLPVDSKKKYVYSLDNPFLTTYQRDFYEENGFLVVKCLVFPADLHKYRERFRKVCAKEIEIPGLIVMKDVSISKSEFKDDERAVTKIQDFQFDPVFVEYCRHPEVLKYASCFIGPDVMAMHTMLINKPPDPGTKSSRHPMHQDLHYFPFRPADSIVCSWTAMEHVHRKNGCLVVLPGTHKTHLLSHAYPKWEGGVNKMYHGIMDYDPSHPRVHLEMEEGDTVFFHPLLIHGSGMNRTSGFRKAISTHYASSHCKYIDVTGTSQEIISQEVEKLARKRLGSTDSNTSIPFDLLWRIKGVLVSGKQVNL